MEHKFGTYENEKFGWDVEKLFEASKNIPSEELNLETIDLNQYDYQWSKSKNSMADALWHFERIHNANLTYPIIINEENEIMDGWHRIIKAKCLGIIKIKCVRIKMPDPDFCLI